MSLSKNEQLELSRNFFEKHPEKKPQMTVPCGSVDIDEANNSVRDNFNDWEKRIATQRDV